MNDKPTYEELLIENERLKRLLSKNEELNFSTKSQLQENRNLLRIVIDTLPFWQSCVDLEGNYMIANKYYEKTFNVPLEQVENHNFKEFFPPILFERHKNLLSECVKTGQIIEGDDEHDFEENKTTYLHYIYTPLYDLNNNIYGVAAAAFDTTKTKELENELKKLNIDKDRFIKILAHDLKNPFNSLLGFSDLLIENLHEFDKENIEKQLKIINRTIHKTFQLLEDILEWTNSKAGNLPFKPGIIKLNEICNEQIEQIKYQAYSKKIAIKYFESEQIRVRADVNMLKAILRNLIRNAVKFTNADGLINIYAEKAEKNVIITVSDNGIGIMQEDITKLWNISDRLINEGTAGETGTGFGLLLCKEFVERHNGKIWVESEFGKGSDFKFSLPLNDD